MKTPDSALTQSPRRGQCYASPKAQNIHVPPKEWDIHVSPEEWNIRVPPKEWDIRVPPEEQNIYVAPEERNIPAAPAAAGPRAGSALPCSVPTWRGAPCPGRLRRFLPVRGGPGGAEVCPPRPRCGGGDRGPWRGGTRARSWVSGGRRGRGPAGHPRWALRVPGAGGAVPQGRSGAVPAPGSPRPAEPPAGGGGTVFL